MGRSGDAASVEGDVAPARPASRVIDRAQPLLSAPVVLVVIVLLVLFGWLVPSLTSNSSPVQAYWLVLPAVIAGFRFGVFGAITASACCALVSSPLTGLATDSHHQPISAWFGEVVFIATVSTVVAGLVNRLKHADDRVLALVTEQRETARSAAEERGNLTLELQRRINQDALTELTNRSAFVVQLQAALRAHPSRTAVLFVDLDDFKTVNDTLGHAVGDELIVAVAQRLSRGSRGGDVVARFGGDEFAVLLCDVAGSEALGPARRILAELKAPFNLCGRTVVVRASGGLAVSEGSTQVGAEQRAQDLLKQADLAMYASKVQRTRGVTLFHEGMQNEMQQRLALESDMHRALADAQFFLLYQPICELRSGRVRSVEALLRWEHHERGLISPAEFIPIAEQTGMIVPLTLWVIRHAAEQLRTWDASPLTSGLNIALNISGRLVVEPGIGAAIARELHNSGVDPRRVILEITESLLMEERSTAVQTLCQLRALGMRLSVDDFGTGYSSLSRLNTLPIDEVKIDRSFVDRLNSETGRTIVSASIAMAHGLGLRVVAEGVETERQLATLRAAGCDDAQGFLYSRPILPGDLEAFLDDQDADPPVESMGASETLADLPRQPAAGRVPDAFAS